MRAAVVLFVESESGGDPIDLAALVSAALWQDGTKTDGLTVTLNGNPHHIRVHQVMEAGQAMGNGYLWTEVTSKAFPRVAIDEMEAEVGA